MVRKVCALLIIASFTFGLLAVTGIGTGAEVEAADQGISLEQAVRIAKSFFPVPAEFTEFSSSFSSYEDSPRWYLSWRRAKEGPGWGELSVTVDARTGDILNMYSWTDDRTPRPGLPKFSREEAEKVAREFAARLQPKFKETRLSPTAIDESYYGNQNQYGFHFERIVNGIPFPENGIRVSVDSNTLKVVQYGFEWEELSFPKADEMIGPDEAKKKLLEKGSPRLVYFRPRPEANVVRPVMLVYQTDRLVQFGVDAITGETIDLGEGYWKGGAGDAAGPKRLASKEELAPAEQKEVEEIQGLLTQDEARRKAESGVEIPPEYILQSSGLYKDWEYPDRRHWRFEWNMKGDEGKKQGKGGSISVSVEAKSGELLSFRIYEWDEGTYSREPDVRFTRDQARRIAEDYLKKVQPERFSSCKLGEEEGPRLVPEEVKPRFYSFKFERYVNDVPFPQQGFTVEVNSTTGKVTAYDMNWAELAFPVPEEILVQEKVVETYLKSNQFVLCYMRPFDPQFDGPNRKRPVRLVYRVLSGKPMWEQPMIDAKSGAFLDSEGNPIQERATFSDISGHEAREAIEILADRMIVVGMPDGMYHPDEPITQASFLAMLVRAKGFRPSGLSRDPWYSDYEGQARLEGILKEGEELLPYTPITRETAAVWTIRALGQGDVASLRGIWNVPASDTQDIKAPGYVALYLAQGLDPDPRESFRPNGTMTRAQAAQAVVSFLRQPCKGGI